MIIQNESDLAMIPMSSVLLIAVKGTIFLSKTCLFFNNFYKNNKIFFCNDPKAMKNLSQMNGDRLIRWTIVPAIKDLRSSRLKKLLQHGFFCIFSFVILVNPS